MSPSLYRYSILNPILQVTALTRVRLKDLKTLRVTDRHSSFEQETPRPPALSGVNVLN